MIPLRVGSVVEGHGETEATPQLIRRIARAIDPTLAVEAPRPIRVPRSKLIRRGGLEKAVELAARRIAPHGAVLVLIDGDEDCPAKLGPALHLRATTVRSDLPIAVVIAKPEFEAWFLAAAVSLRGCRGLSPLIDSHPDPESVHNPKRWLDQHMQERRHYSETVDQAALASQMDLTLARRADSFDKCYREIARLLKTARLS